MLLARGYQFRWEEAHDRNALSEACKLLTVYVDELPNNNYGHDQLGWCLSHMGNRALAKKEFLRALELDPADDLAKEKLTYVQ
jgi:tetratricopeptide (TPR) repeat protein